MPRRAARLIALSENTRLGWMLEYLAPMDIMVVSNLRACKWIRADTIMSALDVLD
jgi:hypothetical protein